MANAGSNKPRATDTNASPSPSASSTAEGEALHPDDSDVPTGSNTAAGHSSNGSERQLSNTLRYDLLPNHPIVTGEYTVPTPMLIRAHEESRDRVWSRRTGVVFYGVTRTGKTTCAESVRDYLSEEFPHIFITMASGRRSLRPKEGHMARLILEGSGHVLSGRSDPALLLRNVILDIQTNVANLGGQQYVLMLDEVNLCNEFDLTALLEIHNILAMKGITMTTISFGQPEVLSLINSLRATAQEQIIARFFRKPIPFVGCNDVATLKDFLEQLDDNAEWPEGSGWTFTFFFFPEAYHAGFRMSAFAPEIWAGLVGATSEQSHSFAMETISLLVKGIYLGSMSRDRPGMVLSEKEIATALQTTDL